MSATQLWSPHKSHGVTVGFPKAQPYGCDTSRMVCDEADVWAYRESRTSFDYTVADSHFRIHDCTGGVFALFTIDRDLISIHKGYGADLDAFAHAVQLMRDRG